MPLHPVVQKMLDGMKASGWQGVAATTPAEARNFMASRTPLFGTGPAIGKIEDRTIPTRFGTIRGRMLLPKAPPVALVVFYHGGGWVFGGLDESELLARFLVDKTGAAVVLVDYRLAPEHPFPAPLEDSFDALLWCADEAKRLGVPLIVAGDSAGGNLATVSAMLARDRGGPAIALQILIYPVCDGAMDTPSYRDFASGFGLAAADMAWFYRHYLQGDMTKLADPRVSPLRAKSLAGVPPAVIVTGEYDVLRDEGETYGKRLAAAGVSVTMKRYRGVTHGFLNLQNLVDVAQSAMADIGAATARIIGLPAQKAQR